jgi:ABC-type Fe3+-siderophore transport system permease subunit
MTTPNRVSGPHRRANPSGAYIAVAGIVLFNLTPFLQWYDDEQGNSVSGYEGDSLIPFIAYLGLGLAVAVLYALGRATRRQHRGLSLVTMAVGLAAFLQTGASIIDVPGSILQGADATAEFGVYAAMVSAIIWSVGAGLLAKEPEGDDDLVADTVGAVDRDRGRGLGEY